MTLAVTRRHRFLVGAAMTPRMEIVWAVLESALDAGDVAVVAACRRLIRANRLGRRDAATAADYRLVLAFAE